MNLSSTGSKSEVCTATEEVEVNYKFPKAYITVCSR
jgi:hypothetical protein